LELVLEVALDPVFSIPLTIDESSDLSCDVSLRIETHEVIFDFQK
jgi:hypothetical protein